MHQITAHWILRSGMAMTEADARLLQTVAYQSKPLSNLQHFWLERLERLLGVARLDLENEDDVG